MSLPTSPLAPSPRRPSLRSRLLAFAAPDIFAEPLVQAQFTLDLSRNAQLKRESDTRQAEYLAALRQTTVARLRGLRRAVLVSSVSTASALLVAYFFRATAMIPMLPRPVLAVGSIFAFATATVAYFRWRGTPRHRDAPASGPRLFDVSYWIGVCWAALAIF
jgi:hypothetical protein